MIEAAFTLALAAAVRCQQMAVEPPEMPPVVVEKSVETEEREMMKEVTWTAPMPEEHLAHVVLCCKQYDVPVSLVLALIERESGFNADAVSETEDYGYMQINECHSVFAEELGLAIKTEPLDNIKYGIRHLSQLKFCFGDLKCALMVYADGFLALRAPEWKEGIRELESALFARAEQIEADGGV